MACWVIDWRSGVRLAGVTNDFGLPGDCDCPFLRIADGPDEVHRNQVGRPNCKKHAGA